MTSTHIKTLILLVGIVVANGSSIKNCYDVAIGEDHYFSVNRKSMGVYNIIDVCQQGTIWYKDIVILSLMEDDGSEDFD